MPPNRLHDALSPYLLQHADNPVDWYPWGQEALNRAREEDRPILLSVGYSACHWCHVMAHESFEDDRVAALMNRHFVNIKVDREERPDLDRVYQLAHQLLSGRGGGWPLTVFLDPADLAPFFAGTYFPVRPRHGMIAFPELLERIHQAWLSRRDELKAQNQQLIQAMSMLSEPRSVAGAELEDPTEALVGQLAARYDHDHGGFGGAPKFPQAPLLAWLMELSGNDEQARQMVYDTLQAMARTGLFDHLAGGFYRYCVDQAWEIPHFEKMLYDNAQLLPLYAEAAVRWSQPALAETARRTVAWLADEMTLAGGGFAASLDADSEGGEGAFYVWKPDQVDAALEPARSELFKARFGLDGPPNFEGKHWHLVIARSLGELTTDGSLDQARGELETARKSLLEIRNRRPRPALDDKLIGGWNGLMIAGLAKAGRLLDEPGWIRQAARALDAVSERLFATEPPRAVWRDGRSDHPATLDDHACVLEACLESLACDWQDRWLRLAVKLAERIIDQFADPGTGALYLTPRQHEYLLTRPLAHADDATPAGAGIAIQTLNRLGQLLGERRYLEAAERALGAARGDIQRAPAAHTTLLRAMRLAENPRPQILLGGPGSEADDWARELHRNPDLHVCRIPPDRQNLPALLKPVATAGRPTAMVCLGTRCLTPVHDLKSLQAQLAEAR